MVHRVDCLNYPVGKASKNPVQRRVCSISLSRVGTHPSVPVPMGSWHWPRLHERIKTKYIDGSIRQAKQMKVLTRVTNVNGRDSVVYLSYTNQSLHLFRLSNRTFAFRLVGMYISTRSRTRPCGSSCTTRLTALLLFICVLPRQNEPCSLSEVPSELSAAPALRVNSVSSAPAETFQPVASAA